MRQFRSYKKIYLNTIRSVFLDKKSEEKKMTKFESRFFSLSGFVVERLLES